MPATPNAPLQPILAQPNGTVTVDQPGPGGQVLTVGAGMEFANLSDAIAAAHDNDVIAVLAGTYVDACTDRQKNVITAKNVTIEGVGGMVHLVAGPQGVINGKALLVSQGGLTLKNFELSGANDGNPDNNLAGVRAEGGDLTLINCYIHDTQGGVMGGISGTNITIDHCEIANNGTGSGYTHNLYTGGIDTLTITNSYIHGANVGHEVKSRAATTIISNSIIVDGASGTASYCIDIPDGGVAKITNNVIEKGPMASNAGIIHYGGEGLFLHTVNSLDVTGNTVLNDYGPNAGLVWNQSAAIGATVTGNVSGNQLYGLDPRILGTGALSGTGNTTLATEPAYATAAPWAGAPLIQVPTGPLVLNLTNGEHKITGGPQHLTVTDSFGGNSITGGSGGLDVRLIADGSAVATAAGSTNTVMLDSNRNGVTSAGSDTISVNGVYNEVNASGRSTLFVNNFSSITLSGQETATFKSASNVAVTASGNAAVTAAAGYLGIAKAAGGTVAFTDTIATIKASATVSGGAASLFADSSGITVTPTDAAGETVTFGSGRVVANASAGADSFVFADTVGGSAVINGFADGIDQLVFQAGNAVVSGAASDGNTVLTLADGGTVQINGAVLSRYVTGAPSGTGTAASGSGSGGSSATGSGSAGGGSSSVPGNSGGTPVGSSGTGTQLGSVTLTAKNQTITGGSTLLTVADQAGGNTITGGSGGLVLTRAGSGNVVSTAAGSTNTLTISYDSRVTSAGHDAITVTGSYNTIAVTGQASIDLKFRNNTLTGGAQHLTLTDTFGGNSIAGGSGGLNARIAADYSALSTVAGSISTIWLDGSKAVVTSAGDDTIAVTGIYNEVNASGRSTLAVSKFSSIKLSGQETALFTSPSNVTVTATGNAAITAAAGGYLAVAKAVGGTVAFTDTIAATKASATVSGGAASLFADSVGITVTSTDTAGETVTFGSGRVVANASAGVDSFVFADNVGGSAIINGFADGIDQLVFQAGNAVVSGAASDGNTVLTLADGGTVQINGAVLSRYVTGAPSGTGTAAVVKRMDVSGDQKLVSVVASKAGPTAVNASGYGDTITATSNGAVQVSGTTGAAKVSLQDGDHRVDLGGSGNSVTVGRGNSVINAGTGDAIVHAGTGNDTITVAGWNNLLDGGIGRNTLNGGSGHDTFVLNAPGKGFDRITGLTLANNDVLDLSRTLAGTGIAKDLSNLRQFISASNAADGTMLFLDSSGRGSAGVAFAFLQGASTGLSGLIDSHAIMVNGKLT